MIEEREIEARTGERISSSGALSLDAPRTTDGFTILDTLGDEDEALAELVGEAA